MCLIMVLQHTVIIQVFGVFVPIQHKWSLNIACVQRHNFIQVSYSFNYNNPLNYLSSVKKKTHEHGKKLRFRWWCCILRLFDGCWKVLLRNSGQFLQYCGFYDHVLIHLLCI